MIREVLSHYPHASWNSLALLLFFGFFVGMNVRLFLSRKVGTDLSSMPLKEDHDHE